MRIRRRLVVSAPPRPRPWVGPPTARPPTARPPTAHPPTARPPTAALLTAALLTAALLSAGCGATAQSAGGSGPLQVVAAENFWGSIAAQLGGDRVRVSSIIVNPATDPHSYQPTAGDARTIAGARLAIVNGIGYDAWASKLLAADQPSGQSVLDVGHVLGLRDGDNPHQWYDPASVQRVIDQLTADYQRLDPAHSSYFQLQRTSFEQRARAGYHELIAQISSRYAGVPVGASESIFAPLAPALGLRLATPAGFMKAVAEGTDPTASDKTTADAQTKTKAIKVWVYNSQNTTPDVSRLTAEAHAAGIPVTTVTETLAPASATFQQWQSAELRSLEQALARATGH
jgi:zinc/manganese transport system substrate-binding protein